MFMFLSISDIGVGVLSMAASGVFGPFWENLYNYYQQGSRSPLIITSFSTNSLTFFLIYSQQLSLLTDCSLSPRNTVTNTLLPKRD